MANSTHTETAKIYQFPLGNSTRRTVQPTEAKVMILDRKLTRFADAAYGSGWYHEAAIEAEHKPKF